jgi:hypothetical protein
MPDATNKKGRPQGRPGQLPQRLRLRPGFGPGFGARLLGLDDGFFAFDVSLAALFMFGFVVLFSHNCLYFIR